MKRPTLSFTRAFDIFKEMQRWRVLLADSSKTATSEGLINCAKAWSCFEELSGGLVKIKFDSRLDDAEDKHTLATNMAFVVRLGDLIHLHVSPKKYLLAEKGAKLQNFILGHELTHIALNHNSTSTRPVAFQLADHGRVGNEISVPNSIELEAHYGAIFFVVGEKLFDKNLDLDLLVKQAAVDPTYLRKAYAICQLDEMQSLYKARKSVKRIAF